MLLAVPVLGRLVLLLHDHAERQNALTILGGISLFVAGDYVFPELRSGERRGLAMVWVVRSHVREVHVFAANVIAKQTQAHLAFSSECGSRRASWDYYRLRHRS